MKTRLIAAFAALLVMAWSVAAETKPRPLSEAERAGTALVASFLASGPEAFWNALAADAPLRKLGHDEALREINVRVGSRERAEWYLQTTVAPAAERYAAFTVSFPSGIDDVVWLEMRKDPGAWRVVSIRTSAEPVADAFTFDSADVDASSGSPRLDALFDTDLAVLLVLPAAMLALIAAAAFPVAAVRSSIALSCSTLLFVAATAVAIYSSIPRAGEGAAAEPKTPASAFLKLASLQPLRNAMVSGADPASTNWSSASAANDVAAIWQARIFLERRQYAGVRRTLEGVPGAMHSPMARLVLARALFLEKKVESAIVAYERAERSGIGHDASWSESAANLASLGYEEHALEAYRQVAALGSRDPDVYYSLAVLLALAEKEDEAEKMFLQAWHMQPIERSDALRLGMLWQVYRRAAPAKALQIGSALEASFAVPCGGGIVVPAGSQAAVSGEYLVIQSGESHLHVPGGTAFAPAGCRVIDAGETRRREEASALADIAVTRQRVTSPAAFADARFRSRAVTTVTALAKRNRWQDLVQLTETLAPSDERVPLQLLIARGTALSRVHDRGRLRILVLGLLNNPVVRRSRDPFALSMVANLVAELDLYEGAIGLLAKAQKQSDLPGLQLRIVQLSLERDLAKSSLALRTQHFVLRYHRDTNVETVQRAGEILELELARMRREWLALGEFKPTVVNILRYQDFAAYAGSPFILGLYTDEIFLPIAGVERFEPEIVAIMTHELMHAMLTQKTDDRAPRWFHEAFASRVEMAEHTINPFLQYNRDDLLSIALLDSAVEDSPDPEMIGQAYGIGETMLRFIEARRGRAAIQQLIQAFMRGATTEEALRDVTGLSMVELDRQAREWAFAQPYFTGSVVRYVSEVKPKRGAFTDFGE